MCKYYMVEVSTKLPILITDNDLKENANLFQVVVDKTQELVDEYDMNESTFKVKLIAGESIENEATKEPEAV